MEIIASSPDIPATLRDSALPCRLPGFSEQHYSGTVHIFMIFVLHTSFALHLAYSTTVVKLMNILLIQGKGKLVGLSRFHFVRF